MSVSPCGRGLINVMSYCFDKQNGRTSETRWSLNMVVHTLLTHIYVQTPCKSGFCGYTKKKWIYKSDIWCITESFLWVRRLRSFKASILIHYMEKSDSHHLIICPFAHKGLEWHESEDWMFHQHFLYNVNGNMVKMHMYVIILYHNVMLISWENN